MPGTGTEMAGASGIAVVSFDPTGTLGTIYALNRWVDATVLSRNWGVKEKVATAYALADLDGELGSVPYSGNIGVQLMHTDQSATGNQVDLAHCTGITVDTCPYIVRHDGTTLQRLPAQPEPGLRPGPRPEAAHRRGQADLARQPRQHEGQPGLQRAERRARCNPR